MKKILFLTISSILIYTISIGQINFESSYIGNLKLCNLTNSGYKYYTFNKTTNEVKVYNTNHSLYRTISVASPTGSQIYQDVILLSDNLFNTDTLLEFVITYKLLPTILIQGKIYNEAGILILQNNKTIYEILNFGGDFKLKCRSLGGDSTFIYSLPGSLPCDPCGGPTNISINGAGSNSLLNPFPNPTNDQITIPYFLSNGEKEGKLILCDINGKKIKEFKVDNTFNDLVLETQEFVSGTYYYYLLTSSGISNSKKKKKKILIIK